MREPLDAHRLRRFMRRLGESGGAARVYLTGGATAVLRGWRPSTIDIDLVLVPDDDVLLRAIQELKEELHLNVEIAGPSHFLPELPGWEERSQHLATEGKVHFYEYDLYSQVLAKIERAHAWRTCATPSATARSIARSCGASSTLSCPSSIASRPWM